MGNRDDFSQKVKETLAKRAAQTCSNPNCQTPTSGPHTQAGKALNLGVAAHICAAAPGGKRYDPEMTSKERAGIENAIWLCQKCAKLVDSDEQEYTAGILRGWKEEHERRLAERLKGYGKEPEEVAEILHADQIMKQMAADFEKFLQRVSEPSAKDHPVIETMRHPVPDSPPPFPVVFAAREALVSSIEGNFRKAAWLALTAATGMGKTQLARIIFGRWPKANKYWISLRGRKEQVTYHIDGQLICFYVALTRNDTLWEKYFAGNMNRQQMIQMVANAAGEDSLLMLDDLPDLLTAGPLIEHLAALGAAFRESGGKLLTTGQHELPQEILNTLGPSVVRLGIPTMDKEDIKCMLNSAGAPAFLQQDKICSLLSVVTKGHPTLIAASMRWLSVNGWKMDNLNFDALLAGEPMQEARLETSRQTRRLISDASSKDLLDRLSIVGSTFDTTIVLAVANTEPSIARPIEHFDELVGPWVQHLGKSEFEVSALLQNLWRSYLEPELQKRLHYDVAHEYLKRKPIYPDTAFQSCIHLHAAEDWQTLADLLIQLMRRIETSQQAKYVDWVQWFFIPGKEWPPAIPTSVRILLRALQVRILFMSGQTPAGYEADLDLLISTASDEDAVAVFLARTLTGPLLEQIPPGPTARRAVEAARAFDRIEGKLPELLQFPPALLFWGAITKLKNYDEINPIIEVIRGMSEKEREIVISSDIGPEMSVFFADLCYGIEAAKDKASQDWERVLASLDELREIGKLVGAEPLLAASLRARAIVLADFLDKTDEALDSLAAIYPGISEGSSFVLSFTKGSILLAKKRAEDAYEYFQNALSVGARKMYTFLCYEASKRGMLAASQTGHFEDARVWCTVGIQMLREAETKKVKPAYGEYEHLEMVGELAWILWISGYPKKACSAMWAIVGALVTMPNTDAQRYKETFLKTGWVLGWLASIATKGEPPSVNARGEQYIAPYSGIFCQWAPAISEWPTEPQNCVLLSQLGMLGSGVGSAGLSRKAYLMASEEAKNEGLQVYATLADLERASIECYLGNYEEAFVALLAGIRGVPLMQKRELETTDNPVAVWEQLPATEKASIENVHVFHYVLLPAFAKLADNYVEGESPARSLEDIRAALMLVRRSLLVYDRWDRLVGYMEFAFSGDDHRREILAMLDALKSDDHYERLVLYAALANQPGAIPEEIANAQAYILSYVSDLRTLNVLMIRNVNHWVIETWYREMGAKSYRLSTPQLLRRKLAVIPRNSDGIADAARVLLAAEYAAGTSYHKSVREKLMHMANPT